MLVLQRAGCTALISLTSFTLVGQSFVQALSESAPVSPFPGVPAYRAELAVWRVLCIADLSCLRQALRKAGTEGIDACEGE